MKNKWQLFYILLASLLFVSVAFCFLFAMKTLSSSDKGAPAKDDPVQIAAVEVNKRYSDTIDLDKYVIDVKDDKENNRWIVAYCLKAKSGEHTGRRRVGSSN